MQAKDLPLPKKFIKKFGVKRLNPPQIAAIKNGLLEGKNLVVASPTASGKTLIAEIAFVKNFLDGGKTLYIVPLKALASEKYEEFKNKYGFMKIAVSVGDYDSASDWLGNYNLIIVSNEKADSLIRHQANWIKHITLVIADEIHLLNDYSRGPTLEIVLTRLRQMTQSQIIALSATISNAEEISEWLNANLVKSNYRPIKLYSGVSYPVEKRVEKRVVHVIEFLEKESQILYGNDSEIAMSKDTLSREKQALFFVATRRSSEALAEKIANKIEKNLSKDEREKLKKISEEIEIALPHPTRQCKRLAMVVRRGCAFHHAGLVAKQRKLIEDNFRNGLIKILTATPTLSFGVNLPAWRVLIRDAKRYGFGYGAYYIPTLEIQQCMGRAGRPQYDKEGEAIILSKSEDEAKDLKQRYLLSGPEPIESKLSSEPMLRMHCLALIATEAAKTKNELMNFFSQTFFAHQFGDIEEIKKKIEKVLNELKNFGFITTSNGYFISKEFKPAFHLDEDEKLRATKVGKRVSELYIDPLSAHNIIQNLKPQHDIAYLVTINRCAEMYPLLRVKQSEIEDYEDELARAPISSPDVWDIDYEEFLMAFKTSLMLQDWTNESTEDYILNKYGLPPGELYNKIKNAEWLLYSGCELAKLLGRKEVANRLNKLRLRVKHGVKEELLPLVKIKNIGRIRARLLWNNRIRSVSDLKKVDIRILSEILGPKIAKVIKSDIRKS